MARVALKIADCPDLMDLWAVAENEAESLDPTLIHANASTPCWWRCSNEHLTRRLAISKKVNSACRECSDEKLARTYEESLAHLYPVIAAEWDDAVNVLGAEQVTPGSGRVVGWVCRLGHRWNAEVGRRVKRGADCGVCANRVLLVGFNDFATKRPDLLREWIDEELEPSKVLFNSSLKAKWKCPEAHEWRAQIGFRTRDGKRKGSNCGQCSKRVSRGENEVADFVEELGYTLVRSSRSLIKPYELDIADPMTGFAIEYNGVYWHSEERIQATRGISAREYHEEKKRLCDEAGIELLFVWQDDWEGSRDRVETALTEYFTRGDKSDILTRLETKDPSL